MNEVDYDFRNARKPCQPRGAASKEYTSCVGRKGCGWFEVCNLPHKRDEVTRQYVPPSQPLTGRIRV